ncbi:polysaccharide biosynthesis tyrosine autokinase [Rhodococcus fascians]|nr:polysaccharide biosynthesis tyrosine autokinase [Rhodococcus fascians]MBY4138165.1 polysaccharide biosynthesis tyrosine autokinase [Rhodococcus fascians]MBY4216129.1 polysaccharide biosynthesis tyrosine autokinase [Rhodococcus fascians]MBY4220641.1 polysaccharide biosynthesis tyrosine autokinase [Rhodococcus fascians]MBY4230800.1 polysaccharide biosynthesis tyrosine autokinase [Rhodococcus fascians]
MWRIRQESYALDIREYLRIWRSRWVSIGVTVAVAVLGAVIASALSTPLYQASTQLFVGAAGGASASEAYQNNLFAKERVTSYARLAAGKQVAQRTIDTLDLNMSADELMERVTATPVPDSVLLDLSVLDSDAGRAADLANSVAEQTSRLVSELEGSEGEGSPAAATVVQSALVPTSPVSPLWGRNILIGLVGGLFLGLIVSVLRDRLDISVKDRTRLGDAVACPVVGAIPFVKMKKNATPVLFGDKYIEASEGLRELRTNLQFLGTDNPPHSMVITSAEDGAGKTVTTVGLGVALGEAGHSVILVDADLRGARLARHLGVTSDVGLSSVLAHQVAATQAIATSMHENVHVMPAGVVPPNPSELLSTPTFRTLVRDLSGLYDFVLIDSPAALRYTDAALLAAACDGAVLLARSGRTRTTDLAKVSQKMGLVDATVLGAVLVGAKSTDR